MKLESYIYIYIYTYIIYINIYIYIYIYAGTWGRSLKGATALHGGHGPPGGPKWAPRLKNKMKF